MNDIVNNLRDAGIIQQPPVDIAPGIQAHVMSAPDEYTTDKHDRPDELDGIPTHAELQSEVNRLSARLMDIDFETERKNRHNEAFRSAISSLIVGLFQHGSMRHAFEKELLEVLKTSPEVMQFLQDHVKNNASWNDGDFEEIISEARYRVLDELPVDKIAAELRDDVTENIMDNLEYSAIVDNLDYSYIAQEIDTRDLAQEIAEAIQDDVVSEIQDNIDYEDLADRVDNEALATHINYDELGRHTIDLSKFNIKLTLEPKDD